MKKINKITYFNVNFLNENVIDSSFLISNFILSHKISHNDIIDFDIENNDIAVCYEKYAPVIHEKKKRSWIFYKISTTKFVKFRFDFWFLMRKKNIKRRAYSDLLNVLRLLNNLQISKLFNQLFILHNWCRK